MTTVWVSYDLASSAWCMSGGTSGAPAYQTAGSTMGETDSAYYLYVVNVFDLTAGTAYCAEMVAQNSSGSAHSAPPVGFTTSPQPQGAGGTGYNDNAGAPPSYSVTVTLAGTGSGTVTGGGISCPGACSASYPSGSAITLTPTPAHGSTFTGWSGACSGTGPCQLAVSADVAATATFAQISTPGHAPRCTLVPKGSSVLLRKSSHHQSGTAQNAPGTLAFAAHCDQSAQATVRGTLTESGVPHAGKHGRTFPLAPLHVLLSAHQSQVVRIPVPPLAVAALRGNARESALVILRATNVNGTVTARAVIARIRGVG